MLGRFDKRPAEATALCLRRHREHAEVAAFPLD